MSTPSLPQLRTHLQGETDTPLLGWEPYFFQAACRQAQQAAQAWLEGLDRWLLAHKPAGWRGGNLRSYRKPGERGGGASDEGETSARVVARPAAQGQGAAGGAEPGVASVVWPACRQANGQSNIGPFLSANPSPPPSRPRRLAPGPRAFPAGAHPYRPLPPPPTPHDCTY